MVYDEIEVPRNGALLGFPLSGTATTYPDSPSDSDANDVETVSVTLSAPAVDDQLFVRIKAEK